MPTSRGRSEGRRGGRGRSRVAEEWRTCGGRRRVARSRRLLLLPGDDAKDRLNVLLRRDLAAEQGVVDELGELGLRDAGLSSCIPNSGWNRGRSAVLGFLLFYL